jgi:glyoxylase-like metal-dependent hydrolase (beta-lactamase superfamily II)
MSYVSAIACKNTHAYSKIGNHFFDALPNHFRITCTMLKITPLSEGTFTIGRDKIFVPFDVHADRLEDRPLGSLLVEVQPFLVQTSNDNIIVDTGLGFHLPDGELQIHHNLRQLGMEPEDITQVVLSHLHKDHAGGISYFNKHKERLLTFPNARYHIYKQEFDYALENNSLSYLADEFRFLAHKSVTNFYTELNGQLTPNIYHEKSGGHCEHHQVLLFTDGNQKAFFGGDEAAQLKQLKVRYVAKYDFNGKLASELREQYLERGKKEVWQFMFYHDVKTPVAVF